MDRNEPTPAQSTTTPPTPDDESITTSTESDTFETWTLVTDKSNKKAAAAEEKSKLQLRDAHSGIEVLKHGEDSAEENETEEAEREQELQQREPKTENDSSVDELSDGISIISESDSGGRLSPHPYLHEHLSNLNLKFSTGNVGLPRPQLTPPNSPVLASLTSNIFEVASESSQLRQRRSRRSRSTSSGANKNALQLTTEAAGTVAASTRPIMRRGITGIFYVGVTLAALAFIGKLRYPEWDPLASSKPIAELEQKLIGMELQNNLMRAEIDVLSKQVRNLNTLSEHKRSGSRKAPNIAAPPVPEAYQKRVKPYDAEFKSKMFKAWLGNGQGLSPVEITKGDMKRPHKCTGDSFVEIAGMCVEQAAAELLVDEVGGAVHDVLQKNSAFQAFEKLTEQLDVFSENPFDKTDNSNAQPATGTPIKEEKPRRVEEHNRKWSGERHNVERAGNGNYEKKPQQPRREQQRFKDHATDNGSGERPNKRTYTSKERSSKERYTERQSHKSHHSGERTNNQDGQWHEKRMQYRENARRQNEQQQRNEKNWYINRGDSREQMRHNDMHH